jgi:hypothetical protein
MAPVPDEPPPPDSDPRDPEAIVRAVLETATAAEAEAVQRAVASDPQAARLAGVLRDVRRAIVDARTEAADPPPASLFARAKALSSLLPTPPSWFDRMTATVLARIDGAADGFLGGFSAVPALRGPNDGALVTFAHANARLDLSAARAADGTTSLRIQLEIISDSGSLAGEFLVLDAESGAVIASGPISADGAAVATLRAGEPPSRRVEIVVRAPQEVLVASGLELP